MRPDHYRQARRHLAGPGVSQARTRRRADLSHPARGLLLCPAGARSQTERMTNARRQFPRLRHHAARRCPAGGPDPDRRGQAGHRAAPGRVRRRLHRGRLARRDPQGHRVLPAGPHRAPAHPRHPGGLRLYPAPRRGDRRRPAGGGAARVRRAGRDAGRQEPRPARHRGAADHAGREPRHDRRHGAAPGGRGPAGVPRRRALLRRLPLRTPRYALEVVRVAAEAGRRGGRAVRHQRGHAARRTRRGGHGGRRGDRGAAGHPLPRRHRLRRGEHADRGGRPASPTSRARPTATGSGPATPTCSAWSRACSSSRAARCSRPGAWPR